MDAVASPWERKLLPVSCSRFGQWGMIAIVVENLPHMLGRTAAAALYSQGFQRGWEGPCLHAQRGLACVEGFVFSAAARTRT